MASVRTVLLLASLTVAAGPPSSPGSGEPPWCPVRSGSSCKPAAPLEIAVTTRPGAAGRIEIEFSVTPRLDAVWMQTEVTLGHGGRVVSQLAPTTGPLAHGVTRAGRAEVELPAAVVAGQSAGEVRVVASMGLAQPDGSVERLVNEAVVVVGNGPLPVDAQRVTSGGMITWDGAARHEPGSPTGAAPAGAAMTVSGEFRYVDRPFTYQGGWTGEEPELPIRLARVLVLDAPTGAVLAEGATDLEGRYALPVPGSGQADLLVRCLAECTALGPDTIRVQSGETWSVSSPVFDGWDLGTDLDAGLTVAQMIFSGNRRANAFNMLDMAVDAFRYLDAIGQPPATAPLDIVWPGGNGSSSGGLTTVTIATDDGYDDLVILHELGHSVDFRYSEPDTSGSQHFFGQSDQQPSLSLSEGFASYFGGAVRQFVGVPNPGFYMDASGSAVTGPQSIGLRMEYETRKPFKNQTGGEADEVAVCAALWNLVDTAATDDGDLVDDDLIDGSFLIADRWTGDEFVLEAMRGHTVVSAQLVNIIDLWDGFFVDLGAEAHFDELAMAFGESKIATQPDVFEPDDTPDLAVTLVADGSWSPTRTLITSATWPPVPGAGDEDHIVFELPAHTVFEVETRYPNGKADAETYADTYLVVRDARGLQVASSDFGGAGANARITLASTGAGTYGASIRASNPFQRTGRYEVRVRTLGPIQAPIVHSVSPLEVVSVPDGYLISLTLEGEHFIGTERLSVGGVETSFGLTDDTRMFVTMPILDTLGLVDVVVENLAGQDSIQVNVVAPDPPAVNVNSGVMYWAHDEVPVRMGSQPDDVMYLFLSGSSQPTSIPGVLELGIGAAGSDLVLVDIVPLGPGGAVKRSFRRPPNVPSLTSVWVQGAVQRAGSPLLELVSTNIEPGILQPLSP